MTSGPNSFHRRPGGMVTLLFQRTVTACVLLGGSLGGTVAVGLDRDLYLLDTLPAATRPMGHAEALIRPILSLRQGAQEPRELAAITVDYPLDQSIFPPDIVAPEFLWHDPTAANATPAGAETWLVEIAFKTKPHRIRILTRGQRGEPEIDPQCLGPTNEIYRGTEYQRSAKGWTPDAPTWEVIKRCSVEAPAEVIFLGLSGDPMPAEGVPGDSPIRILSRGRVTITTSRDPVGAPLFYRDVPLMPTETEQGVIQPLVPSALPLIAWRLRDLSQPQGRVVMRGLPTCANCHSFSSDGKTLGMDIDGPSGDKGMYALAPVERHMTIDKAQVMTWNSFAEKPPDTKTIGFMSQVSPDGRYVVSTVNDELFVTNFTDYKFLQAFYPTRGILAWYDRETKELKRLPGADDARYVQCNPCWSPDGTSIVFCRAPAKDPYPTAERPKAANDPLETPIQYNLYRLAFNGGRGGTPEPVPGASANGMSNSFPKYSPDGKWIVFVKARNGLLMRPDGRLYIMPAEGGPAREMRCNTRLMNSWHTWSPNSRWLAFSSKANTPYTQLFLTHVDADGNDSPAILIPNSTPANRAANIPEFANIPPDGLALIETPVVSFAVHLNRGNALAAQEGRQEEAIAAYQEALADNPECAPAWHAIGNIRSGQGRLDQAEACYLKAIELDPLDTSSHNNLANIYISRGMTDRALKLYARILEIDPGYTDAHYNLGKTLAGQGRLEQAIPHLRDAVRLAPRQTIYRETLAGWLVELAVTHARQGRFDEAARLCAEAVETNDPYPTAHQLWADVLINQGKLPEAIEHYQACLRAQPDNVRAHQNLASALATLGQTSKAIEHYRQAIRLAPNQAVLHYMLADVLTGQQFIEEATRHYSEAIRLNPSWPQPYRALAWILATRKEAGLRDARRALELARRACELTGERDPAALDALAAAQAAVGDYRQAVASIDKAINLLSLAGQSGPINALRQRRQLYASGKPYHE